MRVVHGIFILAVTCFNDKRFVLVSVMEREHVVCKYQRASLLIADVNSGFIQLTENFFFLVST